MSIKIDRNHIFIDTNVLVGWFMEYKDDRDCLKYLFSLTGKKLYVSTLSIAQLVSILQNSKVKKDEVTKLVKYFSTKFTFINFNELDVYEAIDMENPDIEDNIQYVLSQKKHCQFIVTNNIKDYTKYRLVNIVSPDSIRKIF